MNNVSLEFNLLRQKTQHLLKFRYKTIISLASLSIALTVFIIISRIALFELSFDKYHPNYKDIYRIQNNRYYQNLTDLSAGCPPATGRVIKEEIPEIAASTRIKLLLNSVIEVIQSNKRTLQYHNNLYYADNSVFDIFRFKFISGNPNNALTEVNTAVVTQSFGLKYFGKENVLGEKFKVSNSDGNSDFTIKAVIEDIPDNSYLTMDCLLSYPTLISQNSDAEYGWGWNSFNTFVRLKHNSDTALVNKKLAHIVTKYKLSADNFTRVLQLQPLYKIHLHSNLRHEIGKRANAFAIYLLIAIAIFILLIAWINYINLSTAKSRKQYQEIYMRQILGHSKGQVVFEYVFETLLLNILALNISFILIELIEPILNIYFHAMLHPVGYVNWIAIIITSFFISVLAGLYATVQIYIKKYSPEPDRVNERKSLLFRNGLVVFQFTISIVFIIVSIFVVKQIKYLDTKQKELSIDHLITISASNIGESHKSQKAFIDETLSIPGIVNICTSNAVPGGNYSNAIGAIRPLNVKVEDGIKCSFIEVNDRFFDLYHIKLISGENFQNTPAKNEGKVILNSLAAKMLGYNNPSDALNQKLIFGEMDNLIQTVIGVVEDYHQRSLQEPIQPMIFNYKEYGGFISVKYDQNISPFITKLLKEKWDKIFTDQPFDYYFNDQYYAALYEKEKVFSKLVGIFAILIIFISCIGLYALAQFSINNRIKEIGIRKVNGASTGNLLLLLNKDFIKWIIISFVVACPCSWYALDKWFRNFAYHTSMNWWIFILAGVLALLIALITVSWQAYRAASRNPVEALRYE